MDSVNESFIHSHGNSRSGVIPSIDMESSGFNLIRFSASSSDWERNRFRTAIAHENGGILLKKQKTSRSSIWNAAVEIRFVFVV